MLEKWPAILVFDVTNAWLSSRPYINASQMLEDYTAAQETATETHLYFSTKAKQVGYTFTAVSISALTFMSHHQPLCGSVGSSVPGMFKGYAPTERTKSMVTLKPLSSVV